MNILLIFFALPIATIIFSIALQKILKCPPLVAAIIFAIFLIVTFIINNLEFLIAAIVYALISFITAIIVCFICKFLRNVRDGSSCCMPSCQNECTTNVMTLNQGCPTNNNDVIAIRADVTYPNQTNNTNNNGDSDCNCNCNCNCNSDSNCNTSNTNGVNARINVIPNANTNGRTGCICGRYRRR